MRKEERKTRNAEILTISVGMSSRMSSGMSICQGLRFRLARDLVDTLPFLDVVPVETDRATLVLALASVTVPDAPRPARVAASSSEDSNSIGGGVYVRGRWAWGPSPCPSSCRWYDHLPCLSLLMVPSPWPCRL
jgi:hypothetical protein